MRLLQSTKVIIFYNICFRYEIKYPISFKISAINDISQLETRKSSVLANLINSLLQFIFELPANDICCSSLKQYFIIFRIPSRTKWNTKISRRTFREKQTQDGSRHHEALTSSEVEDVGPVQAGPSLQAFICEAGRSAVT